MKLSNIKKIRGQGMSEYLIIVALIAVAAIAVTGLFGGAARNMVGGLASEISGKTESTVHNSVAAAKTDATNANNSANQKIGLNNFGGGSTAIGAANGQRTITATSAD